MWVKSSLRTFSNDFFWSKIRLKLILGINNDGDHSLLGKLHYIILNLPVNFVPLNRSGTDDFVELEND